MTDSGLLPPGMHGCTLDEAQLFLGWNSHRRALWQGLIGALQELKALGFSFPIVIDGSYVTDKEIPGDVELTLDLKKASDPQKENDIMIFYIRQHVRIKRDYRVDFYPSLPGNSDFTLFFQYVGDTTAAAKQMRSTDKKGVLRIEQW